MKTPNKFKPSDLHIGDRVKVITKNGTFHISSIKSIGEAGIFTTTDENCFGHKCFHCSQIESLS